MTMMNRCLLTNSISVVFSIWNPGPPVSIPALHTLPHNNNLLVTVSDDLMKKVDILLNFAYPTCTPNMAETNTNLTCTNNERR